MSSRPCTFGMITSVTTTSGWRSWVICSPDSTELATATANPACSSTRRIASTTSGSSSTTRIDAIDAFLAGEASADESTQRGGPFMYRGRRQVDTEHRATRFDRLDADHSTHGGHDAVCNGEPEPGAFSYIARREERFEDVREHLLVHSMPRVAHLKERVFAGRNAGVSGILDSGDPDGKPAAAAAHRLIGIGAQIGDDLVQLTRIAEHRGILLPEAELDLDVGGHGGADERESFLHDGPEQEDPGFLQVHFAAEREDPRDETARAVRRS